MCYRNVSPKCVIKMCQHNVSYKFLIKIDKNRSSKYLIKMSHQSEHHITSHHITSHHITSHHNVSIKLISKCLIKMFHQNVSSNGFIKNSNHVSSYLIIPQICAWGRMAWASSKTKVTLASAQRCDNNNQIPEYRAYPDFFDRLLHWHEYGDLEFGN